MDQILDDVAFGLASPDFYLPLVEAGRDSKKYLPNVTMSGWVDSRHDIWLGWRPPLPVESVDSGWKVHVSSTLHNSHNTLDIVAAICVELEVPFKHAFDEFCFMWLHHKYAPRSQSGKFVTVYPADPEVARDLMDRFDAQLGEVEAPHILTDRRYRSSRAVHYRYGAHQEEVRFDPASGVKERMFRDGNGTLKRDERQPRFQLPSGVVDPFCDTVGPVGPGRPSRLFDIYEFEEAIRHSNGGGAYRAIDRRSGRKVFIKEARAHTGLTWDRLTAKDRLRREFEALKLLHRVDPGLCPEPLDHLVEWEHEYLVTEWIQGITLHRWVMDNMPLIRFEPARDDVRAYYDKCQKILDKLAEYLRRMSAARLRFGDLNPQNIILEAADTPRLIDFEAATGLGEGPARMGTPGYLPTGRSKGKVTDIDDYALSAVARFMIFPVFDLMQRNPDFWPAAERDAERVAHIPGTIWRAARKYVTSEPFSESDQRGREVEKTSHGLVAEAQIWADKLADGIESSFDPDCLHWNYPPSYQGVRSNTVCFAYGKAGVLSTLSLHGREVSDELVDSLVKDADRLTGQYDHSLYFGSAGIAATLAGFGRLEDSVRLLGTERDESDPVPGSLATGETGRGLVYLDLYCRTGDVQWLGRAEMLAATIVKAVLEDAEVLHDSSRLGLMYGHSGVALFLHAVRAVTKDETYSAIGRRLLDRDLDSCISMDDGSVSISDKVGGRRAMPYLSEGSAGVGAVALVYADGTDRERRLDTARGFGRDAYKLFTYNAGLYSGLAGLAFFQNELRWRAGWSPDRSGTVVRAIEKYLISSNESYFVLGDGGTRYSADVWSGSAGIVRALDAVIHGPGHQHLPLMWGGLLVPWLESDSISIRRG
ncbi:class III lanthionine synthetase LanKC [Nocardia testacea]|uniref:class III lanthionine synthetase LanKC n=1 Tax=Nocardia testacea TaxID=248551 RepID=UPI003A864565